MKERHRSPAPRRISPDSPVRGQRKFKPYSNYRNFQRRSFDGDQPKRCSDSPPQKTDVWIEAGRLAAEYLVSKGLLSPSLLPEQWPRKEDNKVLKEKRRDSPVPESRTSAFARLGNAFTEVGPGRRRRNDDGHDSMGSRNYLRKRMGHYSRGQGSNWLRDNVRNARWIERSWRYSNSGDEDNDFAPHFHRSRWCGLDKGRGSAMRSPADEGYSRSDHMSELRSEKEDVDEIGSKVSSSIVSRRIKEITRSNSPCKHKPQGNSGSGWDRRGIAGGKDQIGVPSAALSQEAMAEGGEEVRSKEEGELEGSEAISRHF